MTRPTSAQSFSEVELTARSRVLLVVEGANDRDFLLTLAERLGNQHEHVLAVREGNRFGRIVILPLGGGDPAIWPERFAELGCAEFHLYDREAAGETELRVLAAAQVNKRPNCRGFVTTKRALENYLHPAAILAAGGGDLTFGDADPVPRLLAQRWYERIPREQEWQHLPHRSQRRRIAKAKRWLNKVAVQHMSTQLLHERDPEGEVLGWFRTISQMLAGNAR